MRIMYFRLLNYAGIFNGMGLHEIVIDFSKCRNIITMISGKNGAGKSTLLKSLNPLPDGTENYLDKLPAEKEIHIADNDSLYVLLIQSSVTANGNRNTTKAFISKNGLELNTTGNVTSYKEILFSEFELDSNYITLSKLSSDDRGLADKTPAERKKFVGNILSSVDTYNEIYKNLSKKGNIYKTFINNLSTKINNLGNEEFLHNKLVDIETQKKRLEKEQEKLTKSKAEEEAYIKVADPDGKIQDTYKELYDAIKGINVELEKHQKIVDDLETLCNPYLKSNEFEKEKKRISKHLTEFQKAEEAANTKLSSNVSRIESLIKEIDIDNGKLLNLKNGFEIENLQNSVKVLRNSVNFAESNLSNSTITLQGLSRTEFETIYNTLVNITSNIRVIYEKCAADEIDNAVKVLLNADSVNLNDFLTSSEEKINKYVDDIKDIEVKLTQVMSKIEELDVLKDRPAKCKIDDCPFIIKALKYDGKKLIKERDDYQSMLDNYNTELRNIRLQVSAARSSINAVQDIEGVIAQINNAKPLLSKIPESSIFIDTEELLNRIARFDTFQEINQLGKYSDLIDMQDSLASDKLKLKELEAELKVAESKQESINLLEESIQRKNEEISTLREENDKFNSEITFNKSIIQEHESILEHIDKIIDEHKIIDDLKEKKEAKAAEYHKIEDSIKTIKQYIDHINDIDSKLSNIEHDLDPLQNEKENINFALTSIQSYYSELAEYQEKYNKINVLKKYSSPTSGIQTLYMDMYMGKTLIMANQLLGMLFGGEYQLLPYVINENEFRIPFVGSGMNIDDISSGSTSQICMIGMIMNLVLLFQASTKYNIVFLDEIDGGLDSSNRGLFINTLYQLINILNVNQLVMISHNIESDLSNVDLIKLKSNEDDSNDYQNVNIIYDYDKEIQRRN